MSTSILLLLMKSRVLSLMICSIVCLMSCGSYRGANFQHRSTNHYHDDHFSSNSFSIDSNIDLKGKTLVLPQNSSLVFKGGSISNGTLWGNGTLVIAGAEELFGDDLVLTGSFISDTMYPEWFGAKGDGKHDDTHAIQKCINRVHMFNAKRVYLSSKEYRINVSGEAYDGKTLVIDGESHLHSGITIGLKVIDDMNLELSDNACLRALPSDKGEYAVIYIGKSKNVTISGGKIEGECRDHYGRDGQHGHCIYIQSSEDVTISNCNISGAWGDCVYVGCTYYDDASIGTFTSKNIHISACKLHDSRRQGISVVGCEGLYLSDLEIYNIAGSLPEAGIDLEVNNSLYPNRDCVFEKLNIHNCKGGGLIAYTTPTENLTVIDSYLGYTDLRYVKNVRLLNCDMTTLTVDNAFLYNANSIIISDSRLLSLVAYSSSPYDLAFYNCEVSGRVDQPSVSILARHGVGEHNMNNAVSIKFDNCKLAALGGGTDQTTQNMFNISNDSNPLSLTILNSECSFRALPSGRTIIKAKDVVMNGNSFVGTNNRMEIYGSASIVGNTFDMDSGSEYKISVNGTLKKNIGNKRINVQKVQ